MMVFAEDTLVSWVTVLCVYVLPTMLCNSFDCFSCLQMGCKARWVTSTPYRVPSAKNVGIRTDRLIEMPGNFEVSTVAMVISMWITIGKEEDVMSTTRRKSETVWNLEYMQVFGTVPTASLSDPMLLNHSLVGNLQPAQDISNARSICKE